MDSALTYLLGFVQASTLSATEATLSNEIAR